MYLAGRRFEDLASSVVAVSETLVGMMILPALIHGKHRNARLSWVLGCPAQRCENPLHQQLLRYDPFNIGESKFSALKFVG